MYAGTFDPTAYEDQYVAAFHALVAAKKGGAPAPVVTTSPVAAPMDFMEALRRSLEAVQAPAVKVPKAAPAKAALKPVAKAKRVKAA